MNIASRFVSLTPAEIECLEYHWKESQAHRPRTRALALLLSNKGYTIDEVAEVCSVHRDTVGRWFDGWEQDKEASLGDAPRSGAPRRFEADEEQRIVELLDLYPNQPKRVQSVINEETGKELTDDILSRIAHEAEYR